MDGVLVDTGDLHYESWKKTFIEIEVRFEREDFRKTWLSRH